MIGPSSRWFGIALALLAIAPSMSSAAEVTLASTRTVFNDQEPVELAVEAGEALAVEVKHADGSTVTLQIPAAQTGRIVTIAPRTLKPGRYTISAAGAKPVDLTIAPAESRNAYPVGQWVHHGGTIPNAIAKGGWMYMNFDYVSMHPRKPPIDKNAPKDIAEGYVEASSRPYALMVCGGGHQLDLDLPNDWGDPWVQRAVMWRVQLAGLCDRLYPIGGLHLYDEPGLTWWPIPGPDGKPAGMNPYSIPHQLDEFKKTTGKEMPFGKFEETLPKYKPMMDDWLAFMDMRMKYLEQCWYGSAWATESVNPNFAILNQVSSSYAPHDVTDGVDSRQNRPYAILSGHGQYSDLPFGTMQPVRGFQSYQGFTWGRPHFYLPMWYTHTWATIRNAVWMSWICKCEGMLYTPEQDFAMDNRNNGYWGSRSILEIAETNRKMAMVGGVMKTLPKTLSPCAVLQSSTQAAWDVAEQNYPKVAPGTAPYVSQHREHVNAEFFRIMECGVIPNTVDELEAVEKGADFLSQWKVIFCPGLTYATPKFQKVLEEYVAGGGKLIQTKTDKLVIKGSILADHKAPDSTYWEKNINANNKKAADAKAAKDTAAEEAATTAANKANMDLSYRKWNNEGAPNFKKELAEWIGEQPYSSSNPEVFVMAHKAPEGGATYLLIANNAQAPDSPRTLKHDLIPAETTIKVPPGGVVYDLFNGGEVKAENGQIPLKLAGGDGACLVRFDAAPEAMNVAAQVQAGNVLDLNVSGAGPCRVRIFDPAGNKVGDYYRAAGHMSFPLGADAAPGKWRVQADEWMRGSSKAADVELAAPAAGKLASVATSNVSIYFDDAKRIADLVAGKMQEPDYAKLNWDAKRVLGLDAKKFAVFAKPEQSTAAEKVAAALRGKGMNVEVNPKYEIVPFKREPNRGGAGPTFREANFENIYAHTVVLPGHELAQKSLDRGHINRPVTATFPGAGRAYVQWGSSCYQMGWQNVFVLGDVDAGVNWLVATINGGAPAPASADVPTQVAPAQAKPLALPSMNVAEENRLSDSPVAVGAWAGKNAADDFTFVALYDGSVESYIQRARSGPPQRESRMLHWRTQALQECAAMAVSPKGDRIAVAGYPGVVVLDAKTGDVLGGFKAAPRAVGNWVLSNLIVSVAWNADGTRVAAGWSNNNTVAGPRDPQEFVILDADGKAQAAPKGIEGNVMAVAFAPKGDTLIVGADKLTAVNTSNGQVLWTNPDVKGAQAIAFNNDGTQVAAGGWARTAAAVNLADGKTIVKSGELPAVVGGVAFLPDNALAVAVWGGTNPVMHVKAGNEKPQPFFSSRFGFQTLAWSPKLEAIVAAEQGGRVWVLAPDGNPKAMLDEEAGTTVYDLKMQPDGSILAGRMNRVMQRVTLK